MRPQTRRVIAIVALIALIGGLCAFVGVALSAQDAGADGHDDGTPVATQAEVDALRVDVDAGGAERVRLSARIDNLEAGMTEAARIIGELNARVANLESHARQVRSAGPFVKDVWYRLAFCETGGKMDNPNTGNGYFGYFQFDLPTWRSVGGTGYPHHQSYEVQKGKAQDLHAARGWGPWPGCSRKLGLR